MSTQQEYPARKYYSRAFLASASRAVLCNRVKRSEVGCTPLSPGKGNQTQVTCGQRQTSLCSKNTIPFYLNLSLFPKLALHGKLCVLQQTDFRLLIIYDIHFMIYISLLKHFYTMPSFFWKSIFSYSVGLPLTRSLAKLTEGAGGCIEAIMKLCSKMTPHVNKLTITQDTNAGEHAHCGSLEAQPAYSTML